MTGIGPLNYTTTIDPSKTASECIAMLATHGASAIGMTYDKGFPTGLRYEIDTAHGRQGYALPVNVSGTHDALVKAYGNARIPRKYATEEQAKRTGWRVVKDWLEVQLALVEAGVADMAEVMLPWMLTDGGERTVYQAFVERNQLALTAGGKSR